MSSIATLVELPPRSASLGRALNVVPAQLVTELPAVNAVAFPTKETSDPIKTLKKEKTKSKVWGFLAGKKTTKKTEGKSDTTDDIKTNAYPDCEFSFAIPRVKLTTYSVHQDQHRSGRAARFRRSRGHRPVHRAVYALKPPSSPGFARLASLQRRAVHSSTHRLHPSQSADHRSAHSRWYPPLRVKLR
jgi:hypothetical protein